MRGGQAVLIELGALLDTMDIKPRAADTRSPNYTGHREWPLGPDEEVSAVGDEIVILKDNVPLGTVSAVAIPSDEVSAGND